MGAVLFDMDGTLIDSEPLWQRTEAKIVASFGKVWTAEDGEVLTGNSLFKSASIMIERKKLPLAPLELVDKMVSNMHELYISQGVPWIPGARELLSELASAGIPTALVSASYEILVHDVCANAPKGSLEVMVTGSEPNMRQKPSGDPYRLAARRLNVPIQNCLVVEDSAPGIAAGQDAGARLALVRSTEVPGIPAARFDSVGHLHLSDIRELLA
ncbi:HAD family phosphatase [Varibaculum cambriense]|uniref:HAD family hydrolase n=1 Tax=Varibaculum cambriense TaxID=184870 RepID=UPI002901F9AB|nr:HAD family phosphatase [Varibaculum cambriense]MDU1224493.1 HAD family phosphatase [Varibaculum cambriense]